MIKLTYGTNLWRKDTMVKPDDTLRSALDSVNFDYANGMLTLDGSTLRPGDIDKTFASFGISEKCSLLSVVKSDNA